MEYFTPIIKTKKAKNYCSNYEISNLGNMRRIGTTRNLHKHHGNWNDYYDHCGKRNDDYKKNIEICDEDVEATILEMNNIKKILINYKQNVYHLNSIEQKYKEIRTDVHVYGVRFPATNMSKANLGFGTKIYKQNNRLYERGTQNNPRIPYGTVLIVNTK